VRERAGGEKSWRLPGFAVDFIHYFLKAPPVPTLVDLPTEAERGNYRARILQRLRARVDRFSILNIHRIGIEAPPVLVWERTRAWGSDSKCWPSCIVPITRVPDSEDSFELCLFGRKRPLPGFSRGLFGLDFIPLFRMQLERRQDTPSALDADNARFLLYRCVGGYPIGLFSIYVRSPIASEGEREPTQFFFVVAFDFYGRPQWSRMTLVRWAWERLHNRVTGNVLNRFKRECETEFAKIQAGT
jgi:hypothetical protein